MLHPAARFETNEVFPNTQMGGETWRIFLWHEEMPAVGRLCVLQLLSAVPERGSSMSQTPPVPVLALLSSWQPPRVRGCGARWCPEQPVFCLGEEKDYTVWLAHSADPGDYGDGCILGYKEQYLRLRKSSVCQNGRDYVVTKQPSVCPCSLEDFLWYRHPSDPC